MELRLFIEVFMRKKQEQELLFAFDNVLDSLSSITSIIKITQDYCYSQELNAKYHSLTHEELILLSEERNHYINMLTLAYEKLLNLQDTSIQIQNKIIAYNNTPTIAADK